jgi:hypothetical protein
MKNISMRNNIDRSSYFNHKETVNTLIRENTKTINISNAKDNEKSQKVNWWISQLDSLGINKSKQEEETKVKSLKI